MVYILLGTGFEEMEAIAPADLLRRAGVETALVGINGTTVVGAHGIEVTADVPLSDVLPESVDMLILPGGMGGVDSIRESRAALSLIRRVHETGRYLAAICAAPLILAEQGLLDRRRATCYPGLESQMGSAVTVADTEVVVDGRVITSRAPGTAVPFALELVRILRGEDAADAVRADIHYQDL